MLDGERFKKLQDAERLIREVEFSYPEGDVNRNFLYGFVVETFGTKLVRYMEKLKEDSILDGFNFFNLQAVGVQGEDIVILAPKQKMTKQEALIHAAFLVSLADVEVGKWDKVLEKVQNT